MKTAHKPKQISERTFWRRASELARSYAPPICKCGQCGNPTLEGYCCTFCGYGGQCLETDEDLPAGK